MKVAVEINRSRRIYSPRVRIHPMQSAVSSRQLRVQSAVGAVISLALTLCAPIGEASRPEGATETKQQVPKGQMPALGRPKETGDTVPLFDFDNYFLGKWTFEW